MPKQPRTKLWVAMSLLTGFLVARFGNYFLEDIEYARTAPDGFTIIGDDTVFHSPRSLNSVTEMMTDKDHDGKPETYHARINMPDPAADPQRIDQVHVTMKLPNGEGNWGEVFATLGDAKAIVAASQVPPVFHLGLKSVNTGKPVFYDDLDDDGFVDVIRYEEENQTCYRIRKDWNFIRAKKVQSNNTYRVKIDGREVDVNLVDGEWWPRGN